MNETNTQNETNPKKNTLARKIIVSLISILITLALLLGGSTGYKKMSAQKESTVSEERIVEQVRNVYVASFKPTDTKAEITLDGRINAYEKINLASEVGGKLMSTGTTHRKGDRFKEGDLLFEIDNTTDAYSLYAQRASLLNAISQMMPDLKFDYPASFEKWKAYLDEFDAQKPVKKFPEISSQDEKYYIAGKNIQAQYYTIKSMEDRMQDYRVYAPFNGTFMDINAHPGSLVNLGSPLASIMNTSKFELEAPVQTSDFQYIKRGQKVKLYSEEFDKTWMGRVSRISTQIDQTTQNVPVFISVYGSSLRDGMYLRGTLNGSTLRQVIEIPNSILVDQNKVFVLQDSTLIKKQIEIVNRSETTLFVKGIDRTDLVVTKGVNNIYEGQKAQAIEE